MVGRLRDDRLRRRLRENGTEGGRDVLSDGQALGLQRCLHGTLLQPQPIVKCSLKSYPLFLQVLLQVCLF